MGHGDRGQRDLPGRAAPGPSGRVLRLAGRAGAEHRQERRAACEASAETYAQPLMRWVHERILRFLQPGCGPCLPSHQSHDRADRRGAGAGDPLFATLTDFFGFCLTNRLEMRRGRLVRGAERLARQNCIACHLKAAGGQAGRAPPRACSPVRRSVRRRRICWRWRAGFRRASGSERCAPPTSCAARRRCARRSPDTARRSPRAASLRDAYAANGFPAPLRLSHFGIDIDRAPKPPPADPRR